MCIVHVEQAKIVQWKKCLKNITEKWCNVLETLEKKKYFIQELLDNYWILIGYCWNKRICRRNFFNNKCIMDRWIKPFWCRNHLIDTINTKHHFKSLACSKSYEFLLEHPELLNTISSSRKVRKNSGKCRTRGYKGHIQIGAEKRKLIKTTKKNHKGVCSGFGSISKGWLWTGTVVVMGNYLNLFITRGQNDKGGQNWICCDAFRGEKRVSRGNELTTRLRVPKTSPPPSTSSHRANRVITARYHHRHRGRRNYNIYGSMTW